MSGPEAAVVAPPDPARRKANEISQLLRRLDHALADLDTLERTATQRQQPAPVPCPLCTPGSIHPGQALCDNPECNSRSMTANCTTCGTTTNTTGPKKLRPIAGLCRSCYDATRTGRGQRQRDGWFNRTQLLDNDKIIVE